MTELSGTPFNITCPCSSSRSRNSWQVLGLLDQTKQKRYQAGRVSDQIEPGGVALLRSLTLPARQYWFRGVRCRELSRRNNKLFINKETIMSTAVASKPKT